MRDSIKDICEMQEIVIEALKESLAKGVSEVDTDEFGKVIDILKDLCEAEKDLHKGCYYKTVTESMHEAGNFDKYTNGIRYASVTNFNHEMDRDDGSHSMSEILATMRRMYKTADPDLKKKMKTDVNTLMSEMA